MALSNAINDLYRKYPIATICVGLSVLVLAAYAFRYPALDEQTQALETLRTDAEALRRNVRNAAGLKGNLDQLQAGLGTLHTRTVRETDLNENLRIFNPLGERIGLKQVTVNQGREDDRARAARKSKYTMVPFSVTGNGSFAQVVETLRSLETGPVEYRPVRLRLLGADDKSGKPQVGLDLYLELLGHNES